MGLVHILVLGNSQPNGTSSSCKGQHVQLARLCTAQFRHCLLCEHACVCVWGGTIHNCIMVHHWPVFILQTLLSVCLLIPSLLKFSHLCLHDPSAAFPEPHPKVELQCRNHKPHTPPSALLAPSTLAGLGGEVSASWALQFSSCLQACFHSPQSLSLLQQLPLGLRAHWR